VGGCVAVGHIPGPRIAKFPDVPEGIISINVSP
jgi:hypothetical protein